MLKKQRLKFEITRTFGERFAAGMALRLGGEAPYPVPTFPPMCVCCGCQENLTKMQSPVLSGDPHGDTSNLEVDCCPACKKHAVMGHFSEVGLWLGITAGAFGFLLLIYGWRMWGIIAFLLAALCFLWFFRSSFLDPERRFGEGHAGPIRLSASFEVVTRNEKLAHSLRELNPELLSNPPNQK